jgi:hypothetical protein
VNAEFITILLLVAGGLMTPQAGTVDPEFVKALSTDIRGIFANQVAHFTPAKIESEFRKAIKVPTLVSDPGFMDNLMFVVRKKNIIALRPDVEAVFNGAELKPPAQISTMKTLYALGSDRERAMVDERLARRIYADLKGGEGTPPSPYLSAAQLIGGSKTLVVLQTLLPDATARQRQAESATPPDHIRIGQLDKVRASIENQAHILSRKLSILSMPQPERDRNLVKLYLQRAGHLGYWGYQELLRRASASSEEAVRAFVAEDLNSILPPAGLTAENRSQRLDQARLRAVLLLREMKASLRPDEQKMLEENAALVQGSPAYHPDWEDVLDRN